MTDETKGDVMTLEQVSHMLRCASQDMVNPRYRDKFKSSADSIDAHLAAQYAMRVDDAGDVEDMVSKALRRAWQLDQTYWQQADSDSWSQNKRADETQAKFATLVDEMRAAIQAALAKE